MNELVNAIKKENGPLNNDTSKSESIFTHDTTTRFSSNPAVLNIKTELFLQGGRKRPSSSGSLRANKRPIDSKSFSGMNSKLKIKPILPNNPNEFVKKISLQRMNEIKEMRSHSINSSQTEDTAVKTESTELLNTKSKYNWIVEEEKQTKLQEHLVSLEKSESLINFKSTLTDIKVTLITCTTCNYTSESVLKKCNERYHTFIKKRVVKSYFVCKDCDRIKTVYNSSYPKSMCEVCEGQQFIKSRIPIKSQSSREEELLVRGFEERSLL